MIDRMTCDEIRDRYQQGTSMTILADMNVTSVRVIRKILQGEDYTFSDINKSRGSGDARIVIDLDNNISYPSITACEKANGIHHGTLWKRFKTHKETVINGKRLRVH